MLKAEEPSVSAELPMLVNVTLCAGLAVLTFWSEKIRADGVRVANALFAPVPASVTLFGLLFPLSVMVSVPGRDPLAVGLKVTLIVHAAPAPRLAGQLLVSV